jgi:hypothetical protein
MAVTENKLIDRQEGCKNSYPVAATTRLYQGTLAFTNASGYLVGIVASGVNPFAGIVTGEANNSAGLDAAINGEVLTSGVYPLTGSGFSQATVGVDIFATDNYTVTTSSTGASYIGQCVEYISSTKIKVQLLKKVPISPLASDASGTTAATFQVDSDVAKPRMALGSQTGGTGDYLLTLKPASTLTGNRVATFQSDADANVKTDYTFTATPNSSAGAGNSIPVGCRQVTVTTVANNADDFIVLPAIASVNIGDEIVIACNAGGNFEMRTPASSNTKINDVDSDGSAEYLCTDTHLIRVVKHTTTSWVAVSYTKLGAVVTAVIPD